MKFQRKKTNTKKMANYYKQRTDNDSKINLEDRIYNIFNPVRVCFHNSAYKRKLFYFIKIQK